MRLELRLRRSDRTIARIAELQHGVVTLDQIETLGLGARGVAHRAAAGRLRRLHRGVYAVGPPTARARWLAAVLAVGPDALLSHRSAAALWGLCDDEPPPAHVTVPRRKSRAPAGVRVHSGTTLAEEDLATVDGIPCTALPRTLLDLAAQVDRTALARAVDHAEALRVFDLDALLGVLDRERGRRGTRALGAILAAYSGPTVARSEVERRFLALVDRAALPAPEANAWIPLAEGGGYSPDFLWRDRRLIVEVDGRAYHARRAAFEHDRLRDRRLALEGYETLRFAASEVLRRPRHVGRELRALLARPPR